MSAPPRSPRRIVRAQPLGAFTVTADPLLVHLGLGMGGQTMTPTQARELSDALAWAAGETERRTFDADGNVLVDGKRIDGAQTRP